MGQGKTGQFNNSLTCGPATPKPPISPSRRCCASFNQFRNFEARGDAFRELVRALPGVVGKG